MIAQLYNFKLLLFSVFQLPISEKSTKKLTSEQLV
jgi:hypothetical protein